MKSSRENVRQRSRVQGAWSQPQGLNAQQSQRVWQRDNGIKDSKAEQTNTTTARFSSQQNFALCAQGYGSSTAIKHAASVKPKMPHNFSWVVDGHVCAMGFPGQPENICYLVKNKVKYLLSLTAERQPSVDGFPELTLISIKISDFTPPTLDQIEQCISLFEKAEQEGKAIGVNCAYGRGRTGTVLACYLVKHHNMNVTEAIEMVRMLRPGSIETQEQADFVGEYEQHLLQQIKSK